MPVTQKDIAEALGVSRSLVTFVLNNTPNVNVAEKTRARILQAAQEMGYWNVEFAPKLCFVLYAREEDDPRYMIHLLSVAEATEPYYYQLLFKSVKATQEDCLKLQKFLQDQNVAGLIVSGAVDDWFIDMIVQTKVPCVFWGGTTREDLNIVMYDHKLAAYEATKHLLALHHNKIAFFTGSFDLSIHRLGLEGYKQALEEAEIALDKSLIQVSEEENGYELCKRMEELEIDYTAAYCVNSVIQFGVLQRLKECGIHVPNEVSLIGYGITMLVKASVPPLTVIDMEETEKATVVSRLMDIIRKKDADPRMVLLSRFKLFEGGTAALCRTGAES